MIKIQSLAGWICSFFTAVFVSAAEEVPRDWSGMPWPEAADGPRLRKSYVCVEVTNPYLAQTSARNGYYNYAGGLSVHLFEAPDKSLRLSRRTALSGGRHRELLHGAYSLYESAAIADFGAFEPAGGGGKYRISDMSWTTASFDYMGGKTEATLTLSRLAPAMLFYSPESTVWLFSGEKLNTVLEPGVRAVYASGHGAQGWVKTYAAPCYAAVSDGKDVTTARGSMPAPGEEDQWSKLPLERLDSERGWMLVWYGTNSVYYSCGDDFRQENFYRADSPFLLLFEEPPVEARFTGIGMELEFLGEAGHIAVLPLFGEMFPPVAETERWAAEGLPGEVAAACNWWAEHLREYPLSVVERYVYDKASDTVTVRNEFEFKRIGKGGRRFLPIPPVVALAFQFGFPVRSKLPLEDSGLITVFGPYQGAVSEGDVLEYEVRGLGRYVAQPVKTKPLLPQDRAYLGELLASEVEAVLAQGHLAPYWPAVTDFAHCHGRKWSERMCWALGGETHYFLLRVLPLLDAEQAARVKEYLKNEKKAYPPHETLHLPATEGAMRTWHFMKSEFYPYELPEKKRNFHYKYELLPAETIYQAAFYYQDVAPEELKADFPFYRNAVAGWRFYSDWATGGWYKWDRKFTGASSWGAQVDDPQYGHGGVADANRWLSALLGYARMAEILDDDDVRAEARGLLARAAIFRFGLEKLGTYFQAAGLLKRDPATPIAHMDELGFTRLNYYSAFADRWIAFQGLTPDVARFLRDYSAERVKAQLDEYTRFNPAWYLRMARSRYVGESHYHFPQDVYYAFMAEALIAGATTEQLELWLDVPWVNVGDYYFLDKLAMVIEAYSAR